MIETLDLDKFRPMTICIDDHSDELRDYLSSRGYVPLLKTGADDLFIDAPLSETLA